MYRVIQHKIPRWGNKPRPGPHYAGGIWKRSFTSTVRPTVHTNPSRKRSFSITLFKLEEFENVDFSFSWGQKQEQKTPLTNNQERQSIFIMAFSRMFRGNPLLRNRRFFYILGFFSLAILLATFHGIIHYKFRPSKPANKYNKPTKKYDHLRPLREMFANALKVTYTGKRSDHEPTWQTKATPMFQLSDLQEVDNKVSVTLLVIVTTAPSRYQRREAIRATWWKKCDGIEVSFKVPVNR